MTPFCTNKELVWFVRELDIQFTSTICTQPNERVTRIKRQQYATLCGVAHQSTATLLLDYRYAHLLISYVNLQCVLRFSSWTVPVIVHLLLNSIQDYLSQMHTCPFDLLMMVFTHLIVVCIIGREAGTKVISVLYTLTVVKFLD